MPETLTYEGQLRKRADRADALEREATALRDRLALLSDATELERLLREVVDAAPDCTKADWTRPTAWTGYTVQEWSWDETTPERFEAAVYAAFKHLSGLVPDHRPGYALRQAVIDAARALRDAQGGVDAATEEGEPFRLEAAEEWRDRARDRLFDALARLDTGTEGTT